jgi:hypothetical protein
MTNPEPPIVPPKKRRGCFFYGCAISLMLLVVIGVAAIFVVRAVLQKANGMILEYTEDHAVTLPKAEISGEELKALNARVAAFNAAADAHANPPPLVLSGRDINALVDNDPDLSKYREEFYISIEGNEVKGQVSLPFDQFIKTRLLTTEGRYLNGSGNFHTAITNGQLFVNIESMEVRGKPLSGQILDAARQSNLAMNFNNSTNAVVFLKRYDSLEVTNGQMIIHAKSQ